MEKYEQLNPIGEGAFSSVILAVHRKTNEKFAIKKMKKRKVKDILALAEAEALQKMQHENVIKLFDVFKEDYHSCLVFECMDCDLNDYTENFKNIRFPDSFILDITSQIFNGLEHIHSLGYFHRDMKPENLLIRKLENGKLLLKISDFGLVHSVEITRPLTNYISTRWYRAPEVLLCCETYSKPVDIWAVGTIVAELAMKKPLFPGNNQLDQIRRIFDYTGSPHIIQENGEPWNEGIEATQKLGIATVKQPTKSLDLLMDVASENLKNLVRSIIKLNPELRPDASTALKMTKSMLEEINDPTVMNSPTSPIPIPLKNSNSSLKPARKTEISENTIAENKERIQNKPAESKEILSEKITQSKEILEKIAESKEIAENEKNKPPEPIPQSRASFHKSRDVFTKLKDKTRNKEGTQPETNSKQEISVRNRIYSLNKNTNTFQRQPAPSKPIKEEPTTEITNSKISKNEPIHEPQTEHRKQISSVNSDNKNSSVENDKLIFKKEYTQSKNIPLKIVELEPTNQPVVEKRFLNESKSKPAYKNESSKIGTTSLPSYKLNPKKDELKTTETLPPNSLRNVNHIIQTETIQTETIQTEAAQTKTIQKETVQTEAAQTKTIQLNTNQLDEGKLMLKSESKQKITNNETPENSTSSTSVLKKKYNQYLMKKFQNTEPNIKNPPKKRPEKLLLNKKAIQPTNNVLKTPTSAISPSIPVSPVYHTTPLTPISEKRLFSKGKNYTISPKVERNINQSSKKIEFPKVPENETKIKSTGLDSSLDNSPETKYKKAILLKKRSDYSVNKLSNVLGYDVSTIPLNMTYRDKSNTGMEPTHIQKKENPYRTKTSYTSKTPAMSFKKLETNHEHQISEKSKNVGNNSESDLPKEVTKKNSYTFKKYTFFKQRTRHSETHVENLYSALNSPGKSKFRATMFSSENKNPISTSNNIQKDEFKNIVEKDKVNKYSTFNSEKSSNKSDSVGNILQEQHTSPKIQSFGESSLNENTNDLKYSRKTSIAELSTKSNTPSNPNTSEEISKKLYFHRRRSQVVPRESYRKFNNIMMPEIPEIPNNQMNSDNYKANQISAETKLGMRNTSGFSAQSRRNHRRSVFYTSGRGVDRDVGILSIENNTENFQKQKQGFQRQTGETSSHSIQNKSYLYLKYNYDFGDYQNIELEDKYGIMNHPQMSNYSQREMLGVNILPSISQFDDIYQLRSEKMVSNGRKANVNKYETLRETRTWKNGAT
ncbi:hypothetical protein BB559_001655 [Furculomyces boomerangus]|uniref:Protein kinase domain-containing protein n=1 Tax=Furculomyces boomerangus TaxID=61424 RepID=A0A2T9Z192_9FUNG|nr:hypothetical protein BB559_001655 [Furculomyces boomerangus]